MKRNSPTTFLLCIAVIIAVVFNVLVFLLADEYFGNFWSGYAFIMIALVAFTISCIVLSGKENNVGDQLFLSSPMLLISFMYLLIEMILGVIIMTMKNFDLTAGIVIQVLLFVAFLCIFLGLSFYKNRTVMLSDENRKSTAFKSTAVFAVESILNQCSDAIVKKKLSEIADLIQYGDPISTSDTIECENRINELFAQIESNLRGNPKETVAPMCDEIIVMLKQRNVLISREKV